ncbi:hypothetical protein [Nonomuraea sp. NPDC049400]|uniref:hypothetical protein n=1 Tax=Nonomuraea sp. NPDC049400 TaxID=3364352 RepID=UPI0037970F72
MVAGTVRFAEHLGAFGSGTFGSGTVVVAGGGLTGSMAGERARACLDAALRRLGVEVRQARSGAGPGLRAERRARLDSTAGAPEQHAGRDRTAPPGALPAISAWSPPR